MKFTSAVSLHLNWSLIKNIGTNLWTINSAFFWYLDYGKKDYVIEVEEWFVTDFWSIPRFLWIFFSPTKYIIYIAHDKLYKNPYVYIKDTKIQRRLTRKECDQVLLDGLTLEWAKVVERICVYLGVRVGWWLFYTN